jgi:hypothetical protein
MTDADPLVNAAALKLVCQAGSYPAIRVILVNIPIARAGRLAKEVQFHLKARYGRGARVGPECSGIGGPPFGWTIKVVWDRCASVISWNALPDINLSPAGRARASNSGQGAPGSNNSTDVFRIELIPPGLGRPAALVRDADRMR